MRVCASRTHESPAKTLRTHQQHLTTCALCAIHVNSYHCGLTTVLKNIAYAKRVHIGQPQLIKKKRGNADTHACVCVQDARIPSQDAAYTVPTLDDLCTVCNKCQFIPLRVNYNISRYHNARIGPTAQT